MQRQQGISRFEFSVVVAVIGIISWAGIERLRQVQEMGEKTVVEATIRNVQSGLQYAMADYLIRGQDNRIPTLIGGNPIRWLARPPTGYLGEFDGTPSDMAPGSWFYDRGRRELVYWPRLSNNLQIDSREKRLRWRIEPSGGPGQAPPVTRVRVAAAVAYRWY